MTKGLPWTYRTLWGTAFPTTAYSTTTQFGLANRFQLTEAGVIFGLRWCRTQLTQKGYIFYLADDSKGKLRAVTPFLNTLVAGDVPRWDSLYFSRGYRVAANQFVFAGIAHNSSNPTRYTPNLLQTAPFINGPIRMPANGTAASDFNGQTSTNAVSSATNTSGHAFGIDLIFLPDSDR